MIRNFWEDIFRNFPHSNYPQRKHTPWKWKHDKKVSHRGIFHADLRREIFPRIFGKRWLSCAIPQWFHGVNIPVWNLKWKWFGRLRTKISKIPFPHRGNTQSVLGLYFWTHLILILYRYPYPSNQIKPRRGIGSESDVLGQSEYYISPTFVHLHYHALIGSYAYSPIIV